MAKAAALRLCDYDPFAWFYDRYWSGHYHQWAMAYLEPLLLRHLPAGARILDVCCGNGVVARELSGRGYCVTGLDASFEMLRFAVSNAPAARFLCQDARNFHLKARFAGALSTFDSLNHILAPEELLDVFRNVRACLADGGRFVFDLNLEDGYLNGWGGTSSLTDDEHAFMVRGEYDAVNRLARTEVSLFHREGAWRRHDLVLYQRCHPAGDVLDMLRRAGFKQARCLDPAGDLHLGGEFGQGRGIFTAH